MKRLLPLVFLLSVNAYAQRDVAQYERVLIPIYTTAAPGAFGSHWETTLWMANDSDQAVDAFPVSADCPVSIACRLSMRQTAAFAPHATGYNPIEASPLLVGSAGPSGGFLYVQRSAVDHMSFQLHVRDTSRGAESFGTRIPVVPESAFFADRRSIVGVPIDANGRIALRIYSASKSGSVSLRIGDTAEHYEIVNGGPHLVNRTFVETQLDFQYDPARDACSFTFSGCPDAQYEPATIFITDLVQRFPELQQADPRVGVRIEIEPVTPGLTFWPMVSVTSNLTNEVTLYLVR